MRKRRYELLLPLVRNDGQLVDPAKHEKTHEELVARFGALSRLPATLRGVWVHEGHPPANRRFFVRLKATLLERFEQLEIYIVSYLVDIL